MINHAVSRVQTVEQLALHCFLTYMLVARLMPTAGMAAAQIAATNTQSAVALFCVSRETL
jgi:hypothetical protein